MSCCGEIDKTDRDIQTQLNKNGRNLKYLVKLLLLGAGESGKSTVAKQFRIIHEDDFDDEERVFYGSVVMQNVYACVKAMIVGARNLGIEVEDERIVEMMESVMDGSYEWSGELTRRNVKDFMAFWKDEDIQEVYRRRDEYQLTDCCAYYLGDLRRIGKEGYVPTDDDIVRSRVKTTGIIETKFYFGHTEFSLIDVGGQRSERRKWMRCFQDVTSTIYCVALSGYNLKLYEDNVTNRMQESLKLFEETVATSFFEGKPVILFLNKYDLFIEKVKEGVPLTECFPEYEGKQTKEAMIQYITEQYASKLSPDQTLYVHVTTATDTNNIEAVWTAARGIILEDGMNKAGFSL